MRMADAECTNAYLLGATQLSELDQGSANTLSSKQSSHSQPINPTVSELHCPGQLPIEPDAVSTTSLNATMQPSLKCRIMRHIRTEQLAHFICEVKPERDVLFDSSFDFQHTLRWNTGDSDITLVCVTIVMQ